MSELDRLLSRHAAFWRCEGDPLLADIDHPNWRPKPYPLAGREAAVDPQEITAADIDPGALLGDPTPLTLVQGDMIHSVRTAYPVSWMASVLGCRILASAYSCSAKPTDEPPDLDTIMSSPWIPVMDRVLEESCRRAGSSHPVGQLHLRGIVDMLAASLGEVRLCTALYDDPGEIQRISRVFTEAHTTLVRRGLDARPPWREGCVSTWGLYAPGELIDYQIDASSMIAPPMYEEHLAHFDVECLRAAEYRLVHLHACGLHMADVVLRWPRPLCVEITLERETGVWDPDLVVDVARRAQSSGACVLLHGELDEAERDALLGRLDPGGLAVFSWKPRE